MSAIYLFCAVDAARLAGGPGEAPRWYVIAGAVIAVWLCGAVAGEFIGRIKPLLPWRMFSRRSFPRRHDVFSAGIRRRAAT